MKKKILGIVLSLTMVGAMLAGCGQQQGAEDKKEETKTEDTSKEDTNADDAEKADDTDKKEDAADDSKTEASGKFRSGCKRRPEGGRYPYFRSGRGFRIHLHT